MGFNNPDIPWSELERRLSGRSTREPGEVLADADGGDGPAFSRKRSPYTPPPLPPASAASGVAYAELHAHSNFSFLDGASTPEELAEEAVNLGLTALAVTDHDGFYGIVRFSEAARALKLPTVFGAELSMDLTEQRAGQPDPPGPHLLALARGPDGYAALARVISRAQLAGGTKGMPRYPSLEDLADQLRDEVLVLTGCRKGHVPLAFSTGGYAAAEVELDRLVALFGPDGVGVELIEHGNPDDVDRNDALAALAAERGLPVVASNNVHYARPGRHHLGNVVAAVRARRSLDEIDGWLPAGTAHLRSGAEMAARFAHYPGAVANAARLGAELAFDLTLVAPRLPRFDRPGHTEISWLRHLTLQGAADRYGLPQANPKAYVQLERELNMIEELGFAGYFLVVHSIVDFCRNQNIYCQGRGSAANSAVCYALRITNVDAVAWNLLFERFLAPERDGPPDIDVDIESGRREEVIQWMYTTYGREHTAQVANVISYRPRSAIRDVARAFGFSAGQQDAWSKQVDRWSAITSDEVTEVPAQVVEYATALLDFPRHLGIHSGGMVICDRPVIEVCPVEWARMPGRTVLQWDKDDCATAGLVKFDLLGLGMLGALHDAYDLIGQQLDLGDLTPDDPQVYDMLCRADAVGVFQVESRAQLATLPRLRPRKFYDLVVEVALIRPGPIQGGSVHPYIRRRNGEEVADIPHPAMVNSLAKTYGVPLFQEQMMQLAIDVAGFTPAEADQLRRAMGSKRSAEKMNRLKDRLYAGMAQRGITGDLADDIFLKLAAFASYGFPESHAMSFAFIVYASAWLKRYHPAAFCAALLNNQPMGFYNPQSLCDDARRHGVQILRPDINTSGAKATLTTITDTKTAAGVDEPPEQWGRGGPTIRLGLSAVRNVSPEAAEQIEAERDRHGPYAGIDDLARRTGVTAPVLEALATAGAFDGFGMQRRQALWQAGAAAAERPDRLAVGIPPPPTLPGMSQLDLLAADVWATGMSPDTHPIAFLRQALTAAEAVPLARLVDHEHGDRVRVGGIVTHRQRPMTANGITFLNLEDETGMLNIVCSPGFWQRHRRLLRECNALLVRGRLEKYSGVVNLVADHALPLNAPAQTGSRDFQ
ncbi:error-prone DNA polymerase [Pilimelia anulata]|uniref:Error-prone DNA polymerase n=1 Tax=Pilimelia anulata TaxID=53371 RepID=A0A8J3B696_9ACTN|nr:error-prone DNA polymerase [Pilimelia anulata]GGJ75549.1 error-prone DNA polymerase [Pilimelia anulata]